MKPLFTLYYLLPSIPFLFPPYSHRQSPSFSDPTPSKSSTRSPWRQPVFLTVFLFSIKSILSSHSFCLLWKLYESLVLGPPYRQRLKHVQLQVPFLGLALPAIAQPSAPNPRHALITWSRGAGRDAGIRGWTPYRRRARGGRRHLGSPLPLSGLSLFLPRSSSSRSRISPTYPHGTRVRRATSPPPPGPLSDTSRRPRDQFRAEPLGWHGGEFSSRTVLATLTPFRRSYFPLLQQSKLKRLPGNCVWIKPHLKEKGGE